MSGKKQKKDNYKILKCKICGFETNNFGLGMHISRSHKEYSQKQYYDKYINSINNCNCGKEKKFINLMQGYSKTCGDKKCISLEKQKSCFKTTGYKTCLENPNVVKKINQNYEKKTGYKRPLQNPEVKNKVKKTCLKKYGVENYTQTKEYLEKTKNTCLKKHGVNHPLKSQKIINKRKNNLLKKYGVDNVAKVPEIKDKINQNILKKYGVKNISQHHKVKEKKKQTFFKNYGTHYYVFSKEEREKGNQVKRNKAFIKHLKLRHLKNEVTPLFDLKDYKGIFIKHKYSCNKCNYIFEDNLINYKIPRCPKCFPNIPGTSKGEKELANFISTYYNIEVKKRFYFNKKQYHELDVFIPELNIGIEYNGIKFHSEIFGEKEKNYHLNKTNFFKKLNITIYHFFDYEWINKNDIVKSMILSKINKIKNKIFARKCIIKSVSDNNAFNFLNQNHIQGYAASSIRLGLYYNNCLVAIMTFGKSRFNKKYKYELLRYCSSLDTVVVGGFSKLLNYFIKNYSNSIISYANKRYSSGEIYKKYFTLIGESSPNYYYINPKSRELENRIKYQKHKLKNILKIYDPNLSEWENMQINNFDRIWDCGNYIFVSQN